MKKLIPQIDWKKGNGLVPAIIQDSQTGTVLMLGYMNRAALQKTLATKRVWFYSRSKKRLWMKGETSKNILKFVEAKLDCDTDALLIKVCPTGPACHTGAPSCFNEKQQQEIFQELYSVTISRRKTMPKNSYTASLFLKGLKKICAKIREESNEVIQAAQKESKKRLIEESVDLLYHVFVALAARKVDFLDLICEIKKRRNK